MTRFVTRMSVSGPAIHMPRAIATFLVTQLLAALALSVALPLAAGLAARAFDTSDGLAASFLGVGALLLAFVGSLVLSGWIAMTLVLYRIRRELADTGAAIIAVARTKNPA